MQHVREHSRPSDAALAAALSAVGLRTRRRLTLGDLSFRSWPGPKPGEEALTFDALSLDGEPRRLEDFLGTPIVMETGSFTCQHYQASIPAMTEIARRAPWALFLVLYVSEAHPTRDAPRHRSDAQKIDLARRMVRSCGETRTVLCSDTEGLTHAAYGGYQNMVYILDGDGTVAYRSNQCRPARVGEVLADPSFPALREEDFFLRPSETGILRTFDLSQRTFLMLRERARYEASRFRRLKKAALRLVSA